MGEIPAGDATIRVAIVEDEGLFRDLLRVALAQQPRLTVVGAFADGTSALRQIPRLAARVAILDIELGVGPTGIDVGLRLRRDHPDLGIVLLSNHSDPEFLASLPREALAGWSYLLKRSVSDAATLARAVEGAAAGLVVLDPQLVSGLQPRDGSPLSRLTPRQAAILALLAQGYTNAAIAGELGLAEKSVENQINLLYQNLNVTREQTNLHPRVAAVLTYLAETRRIGGPGLGRFTGRPAL